MFKRIYHWMVGQGLKMATSHLPPKTSEHYLRDVFYNAKDEDGFHYVPIQEVPNILQCLLANVELHQPIPQSNTTLAEYLFKPSMGDGFGRIKLDSSRSTHFLPHILKFIPNKSILTHWYVESVKAHLESSSWDSFDIYEFFLEHGANPLPSLLAFQKQTSQNEKPFVSQHILNRVGDMNLQNCFFKLETLTALELEQLKLIFEEHGRTYHYRHLQLLEKINTQIIEQHREHL